MSKGRPSSLRESEICCCSAPCFKTVAPRDFLFFTVLVTSLGPSPQSSTTCQQLLPCCTVCLVWLALGAREVPYATQSLFDALQLVISQIQVCQEGHLFHLHGSTGCAGNYNLNDLLLQRKQKLFLIIKYPKNIIESVNVD